MSKMILIPLLMLVLASAACLDDLPPQDCSIVEYVVSGQVVDEAGAAVSAAAVRVSSQSFYNLSFDFTLPTDADGHFVSDTLRSYFCEKVSLHVTAEGYAPWTATYYARGSGWQGELPADLTITLEKAE